jgi:nucleoside-diphosphate-sugar epimerase
MSDDNLILVAGAGGFIGGHLVQGLLAEGAKVRAVDMKPAEEWFQRFDDAENLQLDLSRRENCYAAMPGAREVYNLASDMGGMGFIEINKALCMLSVLINIHLLEAARDEGVRRFFYSSSACVYAEEKQRLAEVQPLREEDAYPAMPEDGYGWEKLFSERMCRHFTEDFELSTCVVRYHNVYGPKGSFEGGREKAPAAICRKVAQAKLEGTNEIEIWGDGEQTRSFTYISDCVHGTKALMRSERTAPINLGSTELVTINQLIDIVEEIAGIEVSRNYDLSAPQGVRGRNSDNTQLRAELGWEPTVPLGEGMAQTYRWVYDQLATRVGT